VKLRACFVIVSFLSAAVCTTLAQNGVSNSTLASTQVPRLIRYSGVVKDESGKPVSGDVGITFSLYKDQQGGSPLWVETQNVQADATGRYSAMLGAATKEGMPLEVFSSGEAQWLGVQIQGQPAQARVLLVSVPYALKAHEAETLGGKTISDFVLHSDSDSAISDAIQKTHSFAQPNSSRALPPAGPTGFTGTNSSQIVSVTQKGTGNGLRATTGSSTKFAAGVVGIESSTSGQVAGVSGQAASSTTNSAGVSGGNIATTGQVYGVLGGTNSTGPFAAAVSGYEGATSGQVFGVGGTTASATNFAAGVAGTALATSGIVYGVGGGANSTTNSAAGVNGVETATTGQVYGVSGNTSSTTTNAAGVSGYEGATTGQVYGVTGGTNSTTNGAAGLSAYEGAASGVVYGVAGSTNSTTNFAAGVSGFEGAATGNVYGVAGSTNSTTSAASGVDGFEGATTGNVRGVSGYSQSTNGIGVFGGADATSGFAVGVEGVTSSSAGAGGEFVNQSGSGLVLLGQSGSAFTTVFTVDANGTGFFAGNLNVKGKLTKGSGSFKIDHPLDPANKYLSHSFVESPDMMNVYNGNITTDRHGLATVNLPDYFEVLNGDFRYQLTVIGQFAQAIVAKKIAGNRFVIRTSKPNVEVSWQVTGIRHDAYANRYRIPVEEDKAVGEQGYYLHPEVFGQPESKSISSVGKSVPPSQDVMADASRP
jgi:trimeric autotransporter adhesin